MGRQDKLFAALYRQAASAFGVSECAMWVLYFIRGAEEPITQQELIELMMFPKQTINSAVSTLARRGYVALEPIPGTRNRKNVLLTPAGDAFASSTVERLLTAEERAVAVMGFEKAARYVALRDEFLEALQEEFTREGVLDHDA
ncbi:MarR family winged helix-turn-helix transcriptional regulator [Propionibacterium australiense]|uniref:MarR family transcriptional regulator n=1 Tax=Propionibacterium australiense TaxID=119981 RepID=A0A8B3FSC3_9ACTN|nr:MarR family transcriptional regulator [Propionibacterium australiense]RLP10717.1 MarR family transcriptional regulator [Propionibacterium australiense]